MTELDDFISLDGGIEFGELTQRQRHRLDDEVVDRELFIIGQKRVGLLADVHQRVHLEFVRHVEVRDGLFQFYEAAPDCLTEVGGGNGFVFGGDW